MWLLEIDYGVELPDTMRQHGALDEEDFASSQVEQDYERDMREASRWLSQNPE